MKPIAVPLVVRVSESHCLAGLPPAELKNPVVRAGNADLLSGLCFCSVRHYVPRLGQSGTILTAINAMLFSCLLTDVPEGNGRFPWLPAGQPERPQGMRCRCFDRLGSWNSSSALFSVHPK